MARGNPTWKLALVTGASSGIGLEMAKVLAEQGSDLVVVARSADKLEALAKELERDFDTKTEVLAADLSDPADLAKVEARVADVAHPVDLLVNNAGFGLAGKFGEVPVDDEERMIRLNVVALTRLTHAAVTAMKPRGRGGILNVSSIGGFVPSYNYATYGAAKSYVTAFTEVLHEELRGTGVHATVLAPGFTRTGFQATSGNDATGIPEFLWQTAREVAVEGLKAVERNRTVWVPGLKNQASVGLAKILPRPLLRRFSGPIVEKF